jgi:tetratricopeptide (TPR) repeat protein
MLFVARYISILLMVIGFSTITNAASVEVFKRDGYDRLVVEDASGQAVESDQGILKFSTVQNLSSNMVNAIQSPAIQSLAVDGANGVITLSEIVNETRVFKIGNRLIVDMFFDGDKPAMAKTAIIIPEIEIETKDNAEIDTPPQAPETNEVLVEQDEDAPTITAVETAPSPIAQPTILTVSSISPLSLSVFKRYGRLFIITDSSSASLPPQISGAGKILGWEMSVIPISQGKAWMMPVPDNAYIRPEGTKLIWRIVVSDQNPGLETADIIRNLDDADNPSVLVNMAGTNKILKFTDPDYGDDLAVFTVGQASSRMNKAYDFIDFDIMPAAVGAVIKPQSDGVNVASNNEFITISKRDGLSISPVSHVDVVRSFLKMDDEEVVEVAPKLSTDLVFFFKDWSQGVSTNSYVEQRQKLDVNLTEAGADDKIAMLFDLIKLHLAMNMGQEALGYLDMAAGLNADVVNIPEYHALTGAAHFLAAQYDLANAVFSNELIANNAEIMLWRAAALLNEGQAEEAMNLYQGNPEIAINYPYDIRLRVLSPIIQEMLNKEEGANASDLLALFDDPQTPVTAEHRANLAYLKGLGQKMTGYPEKAIENFKIAVNADRLGPFGTKSELLLIKDELAREAISVDDAIKRMERLRFVWRGDYLESDIYQSLGALYIQKGEGRRGLSLLKRAAEIAKTSVERRAIVRQMAQLYKEIFNGDAFESLDPMEAISVYDEFKELTPVGAEGNMIIDRLADKLMEIDLMSRAVSVLQDKMVRLQGGQDAIKSGLRVAAIQLIDRKPQAAMDTLQKIDAMLMRYDDADKSMLNQKVILLKARSLADSGQSQSALFMTEGLDDTDDVLRLRVDTAWDAGDWVAVSDNLDKLIERENITLAQPPTSGQAQMILNQAIALNLSNQRQNLQQFASAYDLFMKQTPVYNTFQLVTRPLTIAALADRQSLLDMTSEVDLFSQFLNDTKAQNP